MYTIVNESAFVNAFDIFNRSENFSREGRRALFAFFEEMETEEPGVEFDPIAICCEYNEMNADEVADYYSVDLSACTSDEERQNAIREYLEDDGTLVAVLTNGNFVFANF
jgi:hypothetical protein